MKILQKSLILKAAADLLPCRQNQTENEINSEYMVRLRKLTDHQHFGESINDTLKCQLAYGIQMQLFKDSFD